MDKDTKEHKSDSEENNGLITCTREEKETFQVKETTMLGGISPM